MTPKIKTMLVAAAVAGSAVFGAAAQAGVVVTSTSATNPYSGPTPTYNFNTPIPITGGSIVNASVSGQHNRPFGSTGNYLAVGPFDGSPAVLNLAAYGRIGSISMLWGSIDAFNTLELLDAANQVIYSITGLGVRDVNAVQPGNVNRVVKFTFTDLMTQNAVSSVRFSSNRNAFEVDNIAVQGVPEVSTWLLMIMGMFGIGFVMRRQPEGKTQRIRFA